MKKEKIGSIILTAAIAAVLILAAGTLFHLPNDDNKKSNPSLQTVMETTDNHGYFYYKSNSAGDITRTVNLCVSELEKRGYYTTVHSMFSEQTLAVEIEYHTMN